MGGRVRTCAALALAIAALAPTTAQAFSIRSFQVSASGNTLTYIVEVCGARGHLVTFQAVLEKDDGRSARFTRSWRHVQRRNCSEWELTTEDIWRGGLWDTQMTVYSHGQTRRTAVTVFDNGAEE
jgi:hypothetical protein